MTEASYYTSTLSLGVNPCPLVATLVVHMCAMPCSLASSPFFPASLVTLFLCIELGVVLGGHVHCCRGQRGY